MPFRSLALILDSSRQAEQRAPTLGKRKIIDSTKGLRSRGYVSSQEVSKEFKGYKGCQCFDDS